MNKTLLIFILVLATSFSSIAQKISFTDSSNIWDEYGADGGTLENLYCKYYYRGDTIINGEHYRVLYNYHCTQGMWTPGGSGPWPPPPRICYEGRVGFIREDTTGKVFFVDNYVSPEVVLYDYNLQLNDSFTGGSYQRKVIEIDSVVIGGTSHKAWKFQYITAPPLNGEEYYVIEGVGCIDGLIHTIEMPYFEASTSLFCFRNHGSNPTLSKPFYSSFDNQNSCVTGIDEIKNTRDVKLDIVPHPANASSYIQLPGQMQKGVVNIYNNLGQTMVSEKIANTDKWYIQDKIPVAGMYFYNISNEQTGERFTGKFVFE